MTRNLLRRSLFLATAFAAGPVLAQTPETSKIDPADTAWIMTATALVLMMTIPGLALFYAGMVRKKNLLAIMAQCFAATALVSLLWVVAGYSLAFTGDGAFIGSLRRAMLWGMGMETVSPLAKTIPESLFMTYQMTFAIITCALVSGAVADRMRFSAFLLFTALWLFLVYVPIAHWVWGGGFLGALGLLDFAGGTVVHINAGVAGLGAEYAVSFLPKLKIEVAVASEAVSRVIEAITASARTGQIGDGKIFVMPLERAVRIRTGETDAHAL